MFLSPFFLRQKAPLAQQARKGDWTVPQSISAFKQSPVRRTAKPTTASLGMAASVSLSLSFLRCFVFLGKVWGDDVGMLFFSQAEEAEERVPGKKEYVGTLAEGQE